MKRKKSIPQIKQQINNEQAEAYNYALKTLLEERNRIELALKEKDFAIERHEQLSPYGYWAEQNSTRYGCESMPCEIDLQREEYCEI